MGKRVKDFPKFSCRTHQIFARSLERRKSGKIFPKKYFCKTHSKLLGVITSRFFFWRNITFSQKRNTVRTRIQGFWTIKRDTFFSRNCI